MRVCGGNRGFVFGLLYAFHGHPWLHVLYKPIDIRLHLLSSRQCTKEIAAIGSYFGVFSRFDLYKTISLT